MIALATIKSVLVALGATMAQQIGKRLTVGVGAKAVREKLADVSGTGFTFDAGMMVRAGILGFGIAGQNMGGHMKYGSATYDLPTSYGYLLSRNGPGQHRMGLRLRLDRVGLKDDSLDERGGRMDFDAARDAPIIGPPPRKKSR